MLKLCDVTQRFLRIRLPDYKPQFSLNKILFSLNLVVNRIFVNIRKKKKKLEPQIYPQIMLVFSLLPLPVPLTAKASTVN